MLVQQNSKLFFLVLLPSFFKSLYVRKERHYMRFWFFYLQIITPPLRNRMSQKPLGTFKPLYPLFPGWRFLIL